MTVMWPDSSSLPCLSLNWGRISSPSNLPSHFRRSCLKDTLLCFSREFMSFSGFVLDVHVRLWKIRRPRCSPCEHQSSRRVWASPARPQRRHGPGALASVSLWAAKLRRRMCHMFVPADGVRQSGWAVSLSVSLTSSFSLSLLVKAVSVTGSWPLTSSHSCSNPDSGKIIQIQIVFGL